jgi:transcriptional regulator with XRE-family HTH domain
MNIASSKAKKFAVGLLRENKEKSWRELSEKYGVNHATLNRIANSRGSWLPKDADILKKLGLITTRSPYAIMPRWWNRTPEALAAFLHIRGRVKQMSDDTRREQYSYRQKVKQ